jgi:UDP-N-acetylglucosamine acyltransferase
VIDPRAIVSPQAKLGREVRIGAYAVLTVEVALGDHCVLHPYAMVHGPARLGPHNVFHPFCSIGSDPQDLKYKGERTELVVGEANQFREFVTVNRGTVQGGGVTRVGSHNLFMVHAHVAHDCQVGSHTIFANGATLAGHVIVEDYAQVGAFSAVHQYCRVGRHAFIGGFTVVTRDAPPFSRTVAPRTTRCYGANTTGLERRGFSKETIRNIQRAFRLLLKSKLNTTQAVEQMRAALDGSAEVEELIRFIESAERGVTK